MEAGNDNVNELMAAGNDNGNELMEAVMIMVMNYGRR